MGNPSFFSDLFQKYVDNKCSPEEVDYILALLKTEEYKAFADQLIEQQIKQQVDVHQVDFALGERLDLRLQQILETETAAEAPARRLYTQSWFRWSAAAAIAAISIATWMFFSPKKLVEQQSDAVVADVVNKTVDYTRNIILPDGSSVVLHAGSTLDFPSSFKGKTREVTLNGEAYFDISHNPHKPFIIHTGKVKTIVLGTSFNIKANPRQVTVSVTRGRVRVEDESKVLAVLTPDQQVQYILPEARAARQTVDANTIVTDWTKEDMIFNGLSFSEIASMLSKRYGVAVQFKNEALKNCKIRATFSGTEKIEQVVSVLCGIRNGSYEQLADGTMMLDGEGCE